MSFVEIINERLKRNISIINKKQTEFLEIQTGKLKGKQLNLYEIYDLTYQLTMELITWITNTDDLMKRNFSLYRDEKNNDLKARLNILGIRHAFNLFKHDMAILSIEEKKYTPYIRTEDKECVMVHIVWLDIKSIPFNPKYKKARTAYVKNLQGKTLYETFNNVIIFLNKQYRNIIIQK